MNENDLAVFTDAVKHYFLQTTKEPAEIRAAYLSESEKIVHSQYTGLITLSGMFRGCVHFSAPHTMLLQILVIMGEPDRSESQLLDVVGEIANTIAGNARRHFGASLEISVPVTIKGTSDLIRAAVRTRPFVISLHWRNQNAVVVVDIESIN
ncbi:MAG TPA: chemotaxis protein CheX [Methylophilaceae bacterium]|nr:chemotaxis protein CheX [Methylophilaceae bacterium]